MTDGVYLCLLGMYDWLVLSDRFVIKFYYKFHEKSVHSNLLHI